MSTFKTKKSLGQNFLEDSYVIGQTAEAAADAGDFVVEIGPGLGVLTEELAERAEKVVAVEIDDELIPILKARLFACDNVEIVHQDILKTDIKALFDGVDGGRKIVGNLPYYITTPILMKIIEDGAEVDAVTVMVQKEVAEKIAAAPGSSAYGVLGAVLQYFFDVETVVEAPADCFNPRPKVDSRVIKLTRKRGFEAAAAYTPFVKACFMQRRKTAINGLAGWNGLTKEKITQAIEELGYKQTLRAETLSPEELENFRLALFR